MLNPETVDNYYGYDDEDEDKDVVGDDEFDADDADADEDNGDEDDNRFVAVDDDDYVRKEIKQLIEFKFNSSDRSEDGSNNNDNFSDVDTEINKLLGKSFDNIDATLDTSYYKQLEETDGNSSVSDHVARDTNINDLFDITQIEDDDSEKEITEDLKTLFQEVEDRMKDTLKLCRCPENLADEYVFLKGMDLDTKKSLIAKEGASDISEEDEEEEEDDDSFFDYDSDRSMAKHLMELNSIRYNFPEGVSKTGNNLSKENIVQEGEE